MIKDDRILKPRLRLCPFCGASGAPKILRRGSVVLVKCNHCRAEGPHIFIEDFLPYDYYDLADADKSVAWDDAEKSAIDRAAIAWNSRPWEGAYYPEELEGLEQYAKHDAEATADVVEVVRCTDCKHLSDDRIAPEWNRICRLQGVGKPDNGFCDEAEPCGD